MKLGALGEDRLLNQILLHLPRGRGRKVFAGSADDCAIVEIPRKQKISRAKNGLRCRRRAFCARNECVRRRMESNDASVERFRRGVRCPSVRADYAYCSAANQSRVGARTLSGTAPSGEPLQSEHCRWRNEQHTGANRDFGECDRIC